MLKIKSILVSLLAIAALASCSNDLDDDSDGGVTKGYDVAYVSISLTNPKHREHVPLASNRLCRKKVQLKNCM